MRDSTRVTSVPLVSVDFNNALSRAIIDLVDISGIESIPDINNACALLPADREDGHRIGGLLLAWAKRWPDSRWDVVATQGEFALLRSRSLREHIRISSEAPRYGEAAADFSEFIEVGFADPMTDPQDTPRFRGCGGLDPECKLACCNRIREKDLQRDGLRLIGGGSDKGSRKKTLPRLTALERGQRFDAMTAHIENSRVPESDIERAHRIKREYELRLEDNLERARPGRPLKGTEPRMRVSARVEPTDVIAIAESGISYADALERAARCIQTGCTWEESATMPRAEKRQSA